MAIAAASQEKSLTCRRPKPPPARVWVDQDVILGNPDDCPLCCGSPDPVPGLGATFP